MNLLKLNLSKLTEGILPKFQIKTGSFASIVKRIDKITTSAYLVGYTKLNGFSLDFSFYIQFILNEKEYFLNVWGSILDDADTYEVSLVTDLKDICDLYYETGEYKSSFRDSYLQELEEAYEEEELINIEKNKKLMKDLEERANNKELFPDDLFS